MIQKVENYIIKVLNILTIKNKIVEKKRDIFPSLKKNKNIMKLN